MRHLMFFLTALLLFFSPASFSQRLDVMSLKELDSIAVSVESLKPDLLEAGVTRVRLQSVIERRLTHAGFRVVPGAPRLLYLNVDALRSSSFDMVACNFRLEFLQGAWLERTEEYSFCSTWFRQFLGLYGSEYVAGEMDAGVSELMDLFIKDALSVNPVHPTK